MNKTAWKLVLVALLYVTAGCATGSVQTARTNGAGNFQFALEPGVIGISSGVGLGTFIGPSFNLAGRYGVTDSVDIGARIGSVSYELQAKIMLTDPQDYEGMAVSIAPQVTAIGGGGGGGGSVFFLRTVIPVLFGLPMGDSELVFGPRISPWFFGGGGGGTSAGGLAIFVGAEVGYALRVGEKFWILPHFSFDYPVLGVATANGSSASTSFGNGFIFGGGVGILLGGRPPQAP